MAKSVVIIVGASSGMGAEFALQIDAHLRKTDEIWLIARNKEKLEEISSKMRNNTRILAMDITKEAQIERLQDTLIDNDCIVRMLVNCAGYGVIGDFAELTCEDQLGMVRLNCEALTHVTHCCIPFMRKNSRIIQLASCAAFLPQPGFAVYAATKAYVNSFSQALRQELLDKGIYVTSVCPGPVDTPFFDRAEQGGKILAIKKATMVDSKSVVKKAIRDACDKKAISVYSLPIQAVWVLAKLVPHNVVLPIVRAYKEHQE
ncbi:MAG: SDR family NAD(P)-dependent oxidoreductase [Lachnospiraceae bacterium]|nr:SDR family NAD(P)-dependent oxidoreductase [Lachnospiraceae bacterium]